MIDITHLDWQNSAVDDEPDADAYVKRRRREAAIRRIERELRRRARRAARRSHATSSSPIS